MRTDPRSTHSSSKICRSRLRPNYQVTEPEGLISRYQASESLGMISEPGYPETEAKLTPDTGHHAKGSMGLIQSFSGNYPLVTEPSIYADELSVIQEHS